MALSLNGTSTGSLNNISVPNETGTLATTAELPKIVAVGRRTTNQQATVGAISTFSGNSPTSSQVTTIVYDSEILDNYNQFDESTGIFTVDASTVGWYEIRFHWQGYSLQNTPAGTESRAFAGIYKNETILRARADIYETSNIDETYFGLDLLGLVDLTTAGDNARVRCSYVTSSLGKDAQIGTSITITRLTDAS